MVPDLTHPPHCRFCTKEAQVRQNGLPVCEKHQKYTPWGAAVLAHTLTSQQQPVKPEKK